METLVKSPFRSAADAGQARERFSGLLQAHHGIVLRVARSYCAHPQDRADLVQEISIQAWRAFPGYDEGRARFSTWLYRIALNVAISNLRGQRLRERYRAPFEHAEACPAPQPDDGRDEDLRRLEAAVATLPPLDRALMLLALDDHGHREIGEILGLSAANVGTRLHRLRERIRRQLLGEDTRNEHGQ